MSNGQAELAIEFDDTDTGAPHPDVGGQGTDAPTPPTEVATPPAEPAKADAAPATEDATDGDQGVEKAAEPERVVFDDRQQEKVNEIVGERVRKTREAEQRAQEAESEIARLRSLLPQEQEPEIPPAPDPFDDGFAEKQAAREDAITKRAEFKARQTAEAERREQGEQARQQEAQQTFVKQVVAFRDRGQTLGIDQQTLAQSMNTLEGHGIAPSLATFMLNHEDGPQSTVYLAANPVELEAMANMDAMSAAVHIATVVAPKAKQAQSAKPNVPPPPDPPDSVRGKGAGERGPPGVTYE